MASPQTLRLSLTAVPESVASARHAAGELGEALGMEEPQLGDLKTIVTEASSNVVRHAYPSEPGTFELEVRTVEGELAVVVRDFGQGLRARVPEEDASMRLGLGVISMLSSRYEIVGHERGGTEVRVNLPLRS